MKKEELDFGKMNFDEQELDALIQEAMADDIDVFVPSNFADKMELKAIQINRIRFWKEEFFKHAALFGGVFLMFAIVFGVFFYFSPEQTKGIVQFLDQYKWFILSGFVLAFSLQMADSWVGRKLGIDN